MPDNVNGQIVSDAYARKGNPMKARFLKCTRGCHFDTEHPWHRYLKPGDRCPNVLTYDRMSGTTYCRRVIRVDQEKEDACYP